MSLCAAGRRDGHCDAGWDTNPSATEASKKKNPFRFFLQQLRGKCPQQDNSKVLRKAPKAQKPVPLPRESDLPMRSLQRTIIVDLPSLRRKGRNRPLKTSTQRWTPFLKLRRTIRCRNHLKLPRRLADQLVRHLRHESSLFPLRIVYQPQKQILRPLLWLVHQRARPQSTRQPE